MTLKLNDSTLKRSLEKDGRKALYFLAGTDAFLMERCIAAIAPEGCERVTLDFLTADDEEVAQHLSSFSFGDKLLLIQNFKASAYTEEKRKLYESYLAELPGTLTVCVTLLSDETKYFKIPKAAEAFCSLCPDSAIVTCLRKTGSELAHYVDALAKREGCSINDDACSELIRLCGDDLLMLHSEIQKLAGACNYKRIDLETVRALCPKTTEDNVFDFVRAMERGKTADAVKLLHAMMEQEQEPAKLVAAISTSFVNLLRAKTAAAAGISRARVEEDFGYRKDDRALSIAFQNHTRYSDRQLEDIISLLTELDGQLKRGGADRTILMEQGMVKLALLVAGRRTA
ncbi:MAG: DNA polymerase III subunit delta [Oscillospiraceae bacterium]|nr:DNA polymerase III subunit delta [Oscillospiraceae bacterium]